MGQPIFAFIEHFGPVQTTCFSLVLSGELRFFQLSESTTSHGHTRLRLINSKRNELLVGLAWKLWGHLGLTPNR